MKYKSTIQQTRQQSYVLLSGYLMFISGCVYAHRLFPGQNGDQHPDYSEFDTRRCPGKYLDLLACELH